VNGIENEIRIQIAGHWKLYRGRTEANLLNGSYCFSNSAFHGQQIGPPVDTQSTHPGEGWVEIIDKDFVLPPNRVIVILGEGNVRQALRDGLGLKSLR
jgi:hypothetical protein